MKLIDVFNFSHEPIELLEMRLRIVYPHVDLICINENAVTYTGIEREMQFEKYKERLAPFMEKIVHRVIDVRERNIGDWKNFKQEYHTNRWKVHPARPATATLPERWQRSLYGRDCLIESPLKASDEDIIIQSDLDEILTLNS